MKAFCIFDDFPQAEIDKLNSVGILVTILEEGKSRPSDEEMKLILEKYDIVIIGTSQKIKEAMWENVVEPRIIGTASVGIDHIRVPDEKKKMVTIFNAPTANAQSVAEYILGAALMCRKRMVEGNNLYWVGRDNKALIKKPEDIYDAKIGFIGAGHISSKVMELIKPFHMNIMCYTMHPGQHADLTRKYGVDFVGLRELVENADIISVNVPFDLSTEKLISADVISSMKRECIFISVSRHSVIDIIKLFDRAKTNPNFYVCLDIDVIPEFIGKNNGRNIIITPHIAGGTIEARKRMFREVTEQIVSAI